MNHPALAIRCPRPLVPCATCGAPATVCIQGPPTNPASRPEWGGITVFRCATCLFDVAAQYPLYPPGKVHVSRTGVATCDEEILIPVDLSGVTARDWANAEPPDELPWCCPKGHQFTTVEIANLLVQVAVVFEQWVLSGAMGNYLAELEGTRNES